MRRLAGTDRRLRRCGPYGKDRRIRGRIPSVSHPARRCRSSVVEHSLGKGEVVSSILTGSTTKDPQNTGVSTAPAPVSPSPRTRTRRDFPQQTGGNLGEFVRVCSCASLHRGNAVLAAVSNLISKANTPSNSKSMFSVLIPPSPPVRAPPHRCDVGGALNHFQTLAGDTRPRGGCAARAAWCFGMPLLPAGPSAIRQSTCGAR